MINPLRGFRAIFYKEILHMRRDTMALLLALIVPLIEMVILGAAIDTNVRQVRTAVFDESGVMEQAADVTGSQGSRALLDRFRNSDTFKIYTYVHSDAELTHELVAGRAKVGIKIPYDFERSILRGDTAQVLLLVDGSDSSVSGQAVNVAASIGLDESLRRILPANAVPAVEIRPKVMFNPDSRSPNFFLPGLLPIILIFVSTMLTAFSIVREKEAGTLEQLLVTPVKPMALMLGKLLPYFAVAMFETCLSLAFMRVVFKVPIHGSLVVLLVLTLCYVFVNLALGVLFSSRARTQVEALQMAMSVMLPSIFLSGYIFPRDTMPKLFYWASFLVPATYMENISRGLILRGASAADMWVNAAVLFVMGAIVLALAAHRFKRIVA